MKQKNLKELFYYENGQLFWKERKQRRQFNKPAGYIRPDGYRRIMINRKRYLAHRLIWILHHGDIPQNMEIDHKNHDPSDNRLKNLRLVSHLENHHNKSKYKKNRSGFTGIYWHSQTNKWCAQIKINGEQKHLGLFKNIEDAIAARRKVEILFGFHPNHGL